ncbi:MAG TPA: ribose-5-phosphate isomerase RpiA [Ktedonobacteraceae bacterium]|jgi:ribose 5-phosphate isomerase A|nr:ribose-5-phosphate isomerase RpiA [Ktedonobacteraceae bacterium]
MQHDSQQETWKHLAGMEAAKLVEDGMLVGLGSGTTATHMVYALAQRIAGGLRIAGAVPTSQTTEQLARSLGIPLTDLDTHPELDLDIDGADEIDEQLNLIKGGGGALLREKIVAAASRRFVVIADITKLVTKLGLATPVPVEVIPFAITPVSRHIEALGAEVRVRHLGENLYHTDNGNLILDCFFANGLDDPLSIHKQMSDIVGVVETGLFLHMAEGAIVGAADGVKFISV